MISRITFKILSSHRLAHHTGNDDYITNNFTNREQRQKRARHARAGTGTNTSLAHKQTRGTLLVQKQKVGWTSRRLARYPTGVNDTNYKTV